MALDLSPETSRILGDPSFLPTAGEVSGSFSYTYSADLYDFSSSRALSFPSSYDRSGTVFLPRLDYGITDDITVFADLGWGNTRTREAYTYNRLVFTPFAALAKLVAVALAPSVDTGFRTYSPRAGAGSILRNPFQFPRIVPTASVAHFRALGADNPVFGATWRVIDQRAAPVSVDLTGSYQPDIFQSRASGALQTGTLAAGGQSGTAELAVSRETRALTLRAFGAFTYDGRRNELAVGETADLRSAAHPSYSVGLQTQLRLLPWLAIDSGVTAQQSVQFDRFDISRFGTTSDTIHPAGSISPYAGLLVPLIDRHLVAEAQYQHHFIDNETVQFAGGVQTRAFHQESNLFTARVLFAFGGAASPRIIGPEFGNMVPAPATPARTYLVFFDWDRADLTERARQIAAQAAQAAQRAPTRLEVSGYTDLSGSAAYNQRLSVRRAQSVRAELVRDGVAAGEIGVRGLGESNPLVPTATGVREPQNRRVEIVLR